jgi:hypothetical protein
MKKLIIFFVLIYAVNCKAQSFNKNFIITGGVNISTMFSDRNRLNFTPFPFLIVNKDLFTIKNGILSASFSYFVKGGNEGLLVIDTTVWQSYYNDNMKFLNLKYLGIGVSYRNNLFKSSFYYEFSAKLNYLFSGIKYNYYFNYNNNKLTEESNSIFNLEKEPFYKYKPVRLEKSVSIFINYKVPFIRKTYISLGYELGLSSVFYIDTRINHGIMSGVKIII